MGSLSLNVFRFEACSIRPPPGEDLLVDLVGEEDLARDHLVAAKEYFEVHVRRAPAVPTGEDRSELHVAGRISELRTAQVVLPHRRFGRDAADARLPLIAR